MKFWHFYVRICFRILSLKTKDTSASSWLSDFISYFLARYKNGNNIWFFYFARVHRTVYNFIFVQVWRVWVRIGACIGSWWGNRRERGHWGDLGVDGWIILGRISKRWDVGMWTGLDWPRVWTGGVRF